MTARESSSRNLAQRRTTSTARNLILALTLLLLLILSVVCVGYILVQQNVLPGIFPTSTPVPTLVTPPSKPLTDTSALTAITPLPETLTDAPAAPSAAGLSAAAGWWEVYFTDPLRINDPNAYRGSIEDILIQKINAAQTSIHIASFEFDLPPVAKALIAARQRGVDVRWVTDDEAGLENDADYFAMLRQGGIEVRSDDRGALMHNKFWIFDGTSVWTGSTNITVSGIFKQDNNVIVIHSPDVASMYEREFEEMWEGQFGPRSPSTRDQQSTTVNGTPIRVLFAPEDRVMDEIVNLVAAAQRSIRFMAFSFTENTLGEAMRARARAGVDVAGVFEKVGSDGQGSEMVPLLCAGIAVRQDGNPAFMHNKVILIDDHILITGSFNLSASATENNDENVVILDNAEIVSLYLQDFERIWERGESPDPAKFSCQ